MVEPIAGRGRQTRRSHSKATLDDFAIEVREAVYTLAHTGETFTVVTVAQMLKLPPDHYGRISRIVDSAAKAGLLEKVGDEIVHRKPNPDDWLKGAASIRRRVATYRGSENMRTRKKKGESA